MRVALCTAVWRRIPVTRVFWQNVAYLRTWWDRHDVIPVVAWSGEPEHRTIAPRDAVFCEMPNNPLGAKFNRAIREAGALGADVVCVLGSDNLCCERVAMALLAEIERETPYAGLRDLYFHDTTTGRTGYWPGYMARNRARAEEPAGCHRLIRREVLDRLEWTLWDDEKNRGMDHSSFRRLAQVGAHCHLLTVQDLGGCAVDVKSRDNLWTYGHVAPNDLPDDRVLDLLPADLAAMVRALRLQAVAA